MPYFEHNGANIHYELKGHPATDSTYPILLLHGNGESMDIFDATIQPLLNRYMFIAIDSREHGSSSVAPGSPKISYELMTQDVYALLKHLNINQCDVVGFSDGAIIALMLAMDTEKSGNLIRRIIAVGANISPDGIKPSAVIAMKAERAHAKARGDNLKYDLFDMMLTQPNITVEQLSNIFAQTAIVVGSRDMIKRSHTEMIQNAIIHARLITINGADHFIPHNNPDKLREIILEEFG